MHSLNDYFHTFLPCLCTLHFFSSKSLLTYLLSVDSEMFARTLFSLIFANSLPREFKVVAYIARTYFYIAIKIIKYSLANSKTCEKIENRNSRNKDHAKTSESTVLNYRLLSLLLFRRRPLTPFFVQYNTIQYNNFIVSSHFILRHSQNTFINMVSINTKINTSFSSTKNK